MLSRLRDHYRAWRQQRTLARRAIPERLWQQTLLVFPFLGQGRDAAALQRLRELSTLFLAEKEFTTAGGLVLSDEIAVAVAAQACLPVLELGLAPYRGFVGIVLHPDEVLAPREVMDEDGVVHLYEEQITGEVLQGGPMMLSWRDVAGAGESAEIGYNVVIHEFAHVLDLQDGLADGMPPLPSRAAQQAWQQVLETEYQRFCEQVDAGWDTLIDPYGAQSPDEFFAVAVEAFFVLPAEMAAEHPALYQQFSQYFRQDPAAGR